MNIKNTQNLPIHSTEKVNSKSNVSKPKENDFAKELKNIEQTKKTENDNQKKQAENTKKEEENKKAEEDKKTKENEKSVKSEDNVNEAIDGLNDALDEMNKVNQKDDIDKDKVKPEQTLTDKYLYDGENFMLDNNINIPDQNDKINLQIGANTNFDNNSGEQPFADYMTQKKSDKTLHSTAKELAEEKSIMSTMEENIAIANKNMAMAKTKTVENETGIHKIDRKTNLTVDTIVSYDSVVMDKADVDFFANLVEKGVVDLTEITGAEKSSKVSKTLADLLAKAMNENKPVRIDFDNNISVIIKIDRAGKISADFLPSSQVAEAYLKENLPLLRQRFDDNNIDYNELSQRRQKQDNQENKKKGQKNE